MKKSILSLAVCMAMTLGVAKLAWSDDKADEVQRVENSANVLNEIMKAPDKGIPEDIMKNAVCVGVIPSMVKAGFVFGGQYGRGVASCHTASGWSSPAPITIAGGTWGLQIGGEAVDVIFLVMNDKGMQSLLSSKFKLGADASVAAGPVGRQAEGSTDWRMKAEILTYSRTRGIFAGLTLSGAVIAQDQDATRALYGKDEPFQSLLKRNVAAPASTEGFLAQLKRFSAQAQTASAEPHSQPVQK